MKKSISIFLLLLIIMVANRLTIASVLAEEIRMSEAGITNDDQITAYKTFSATIDESGMIKASTYPFSRVDVYPVVAGTSYVLYGSSVRLYSNAPLVCFDDELFDGTNTLKCEKSLIDGTARETNYNYVYTPEANGYIYIAKYGSYPSVGLYNNIYNSAILDADLMPSSDRSLIESSDFSFSDLFNNLESSYIDDFTARDSFVDKDHPYTLIGSDATVPTITTGIGATRTGESGMSTICYSRDIKAWPYYCIVGFVEDATQQIKLYDKTTGLNTSAITINGTNRGVSYNGVNYGHLHVNATYCLYCITPNSVTLYDDTGICVQVPLAYEEGKPKNIAMVFGGTADRTYGYGSFVEFVKKPLQPLDFNKCVLYNQDADSLAKIKSVIRFSHFIWSMGSADGTFYFTPEANPYMSLDSGLSNNPCIKCVIDYDADNGYRSEIGITPIKSTLHGKLGGLQRIVTSADYYMDSSTNEPSTYDTFIFQIHDSGFSLKGWVDGPPLAIRISSDGRLKVYVAYIDNGAVPLGDNRHTSDEYDLCAWEMDKWMHIEVEARIGWRTVLAPRLIIRVNGIERLNIQTPFGYNIVTSGGYVNTHYGVYCPQWHDSSYENQHREILITNIHWAGTQNVN